MVSRMCDHLFLKQSEYLYCVPALTLDDSRTLNSQIASGRCSILCPEDVETVSPELGFFLSAFRPKNVPSKQIPA